MKRRMQPLRAKIKVLQLNKFNHLIVYFLNTVKVRLGYSVAKKMASVVDANLRIEPLNIDFQKLLAGIKNGTLSQIYFIAT